MLLLGDKGVDVLIGEAAMFPRLAIADEDAPDAPMTNMLQQRLGGNA